MTRLQLICKKCRRVFNTGIAFSPNSSARFKSCQITCQHCGFVNTILDSTFRSDVNGIIELLKNSDAPLKKAKELFEALEDAKRSGKKSNKSKLRKWIPDTPEKLAAYIAIVYTLIQLLTKNPNSSIDFDVFIKQYNIINSVEIEEREEGSSHQI